MYACPKFSDTKIAYWIQMQSSSFQQMVLVAIDETCLDPFFY